MPRISVIPREDMNEVLKKKYGARGMSKAINEILADTLLKGESMFGTIEKTTLKDLRDHRDRTQNA